MSELGKSLTADKRTAISEQSDVTVAHIAARRGARAALEDAARTTFGADLPSAARAIETDGVMIVWAGPDQWLIIERQQDATDASARLVKIFNGLASIVDVSDSRAIFRLDAAHPSDALVRSMSIDFDDTSFRPGDVAITHVSHLGVMVWRLPDGSGYEFACARTYSRDFLRWLANV